MLERNKKEPPVIEIKVVKTNTFPDLQKYAKQAIEPCPVFAVGQTFSTDEEKPEGFCEWAWQDIRPYVFALLTGGNFSRGPFKDWMKDDTTIVANCTDGLRPVTFEIKRVD